MGVHVRTPKPHLEVTSCITALIQTAGSAAQEPSLAQSAVSSVAVAPEADASGEIQANTTACAMPQVGSSQLQDLNNCVGGAGDAQGSEADNVSSKQDNSQQHNTGSTSYSDSEKPVSAAEVATAATDHVGTTAASDHPSEAACREPDTSYFADGVRVSRNLGWQQKIATFATSHWPIFLRLG